MIWRNSKTLGKIAKVIEKERGSILVSNQKVSEGIKQYQARPWSAKKRWYQDESVGLCGCQKYAEVVVDMAQKKKNQRRRRRRRRSKTVWVKKNLKKEGAGKGQKACVTGECF
jgi:hypothetical protein